jgi:hypothetical protein
MKNKLVDLNNHLFAQIERLSDEDLTPDQIDKEVKRTEAIVSVSEQIIANADLALKGAKLVAEHGAYVGSFLPMLQRMPLVEGNGE